MTPEEAQKYMVDNQPQKTETDAVARWTSRTWNAPEHTIIERYEYEHTAETIIANTDKSKYRDCFRVINVTLEIL